MENSIKFNIKISPVALLPFLFFAQSCLSFVETKRFDASPIPRAKYLVNSRPSALSFADPVVVADRRVLLSLSTIPSVVTGPIADQNSTPEAPIPLIAYENDQMPSLDASDDDLMTGPSNMSKSQSILPAADPFNESSSSGNLNSTDDLLDLFEQSTDNRGVRSEYNVIPFIPPFTSAPDNLRVESRATYKKVRK